jgi:uncharacterized protein YcnI
MILANRFKKAAGVVACFLIGGGIAFGHVTIQPKQSVAGKSERYTMKVPTEKFVPTVRIEVQFPDALIVSPFEPKVGWKIEESKDAAGKLVGATLIGSIPPGESAEFYFAGQNPGRPGTLAWKVVQIYEDGTKSEWTGAPGSRTPAPSVELTK